MTALRSHIFRTALEAMYFSGAHRLLAPVCAGVGTVFMLHHVRPPRPDAFQPNRHLEITPDFLRVVLAYLRAREIDIVPLDEMHRRLTRRDFSRRFACFTLDDGYRDNRDFALPVFREFGAPCTVYVASDFAAGTGRLWWVALERVVAAADTIEVSLGASAMRLDARTPQAKASSFTTLHDRLRGFGSEQELHAAVSDLCGRYGIDETGISAELCMSWDELRGFAADPLVTIGAHTVTHCNLARAPRKAAEHEMAASRAMIEAELKRPVHHFAYPYGDAAAAAAREFAMARSLDFKTAVTTRPGMLFEENADQLTALPRLSLNGNYQQERFLAVLASGVATAFWNGFRRKAA